MVKVAQEDGTMCKSKVLQMTTVDGWEHMVATAAMGVNTIFLGGAVPWQEAEGQQGL